MERSNDDKSVCLLENTQNLVYGGGTTCQLYRFVHHTMAESYPLTMSLVSEEGEDYLSDNFLQLSGDEG